MAESFVSTYKREAPNRPYRTRFDAELGIVAYIGWYNRDRLHSSLGDVPPVDFEAAFRAQALCAQAATDVGEGTILTAGLSATPFTGESLHISYT